VICVVVGGSGLTTAPNAAFSRESAKRARSQRTGSRAKVFLKRIVATPGDMVAIEGGRVVLNGAARAESFAAACGNAGARNMPHTIAIPPGEYFMLGDNRGASHDSRFWGPVPAAWILGKVE
jgi:signal peptidase I